MPNFDALRTSLAGPLSYLCKPQKPAELYALYTLNGTLEDTSNYHRDLSSSNMNFETNGLWTGAYGSTSITVNSLSEYTIDMMVCLKNLNYVNHLESNAWILRSVYGNSFRIADSSQNQIWAPTTASAGNILHVAIALKDGVLYGWVNGAFQGSKSASFASMTTLNLTQYGTVSNMRIVSKCLQTSGPFPVPNSYYTGFEAL